MDKVSVELRALGFAKGCHPEEYIKVAFVSSRIWVAMEVSWRVGYKERELITFRMANQDSTRFHRMRNISSVGATANVITVI